MEGTATRDRPSKDNAGETKDNQINVSTKKNANFYVFLGKKYLEDHEVIELHALGNAVSTAVIAAENLVRYVSFAANPFTGTNMPNSNKSEPRLSKSKEIREKARKPNSSSLLSVMRTSMPTSRSSTKSERRMRGFRSRRRKRPRNEAPSDPFLCTLGVLVSVGLGVVCF